MKARWLLAGCLVLAGCPKPQLVAGPGPEVAALFAQAQSAHRAPETLTCNAKATIEAPKNSGRYALHVAVQRPASIRIEMLTPLGDPAAVMVAHQDRFELWDQRDNVFYRGRATAENLSRLLPVRLTPEELASLIAGAIPPGDLKPLAAKRIEEGWRLELGGGADPATRRTIFLGEDLRVLEVDQTSTNEAWTVTMSDHEDSGGALAPRLLHFETPAAGKPTTLDLRLRNVITGTPPPDGAFLLAVPPGVRVEEIP